MSLLSNVTFRHDKEKRPGNWHPPGYQVMFDKSNAGLPSGPYNTSYYNFIMKVELQFYSGFATLVELEEVHIDVFTKQNDKEQYVDAITCRFYKFRDGFSTTAVMQGNKILFDVSLNTQREDIYDAIAGALAEGIYGTIIVDMDVRTHTNINSRYSCQATLVSEAEKGNLIFDKDGILGFPLSFMKGSPQLMKDAPLVLGIKYENNKEDAPRE